VTNYVLNALIEPWTDNQIVPKRVLYIQGRLDLIETFLGIYKHSHKTYLEGHSNTQI
jgi:hypothetical protein